jgi:hypothetical protein
MLLRYLLLYLNPIAGFQAQSLPPSFPQVVLYRRVFIKLCLRRRHFLGLLLRRRLSLGLFFSNSSIREGRQSTLIWFIGNAHEPPHHLLQALDLIIDICVQVHEVCFTEDEIASLVINMTFDHTGRRA